MPAHDGNNELIYFGKMISHFSGTAPVKIENLAVPGVIFLYN